MRRRTSPRLAPTASRIPSSRVRSVELKRNDTVDADAGQDESQAGEHAEQTHRQTAHGETGADIFLYGGNGRDRLVGIHRLHLALHRGSQSERVARRHTHGHDRSGVRWYRPRNKG
jgi:hypothetical protein